ncbi:hypothetical protein CBR_g49062 [Chara braunii]|uniref:DUF659 domain-containing protein n=1 Tax=Chara braunii TaxID=69332 RepID=A0A388M4F3_CHABU|nr:hypothetical protein CBR_g49062 [Chara braunii]|eukprot:GBG89352.1 hypothetical protein CBR_g49062 [Chara braunii]
MEDFLRRAAKGLVGEGSSKRKEGGTDPAAALAGKRHRQQKVTNVYGGEWVARHKKTFLRWINSSGVPFNAFRNQAWKVYQPVLLEQPGSSPRAVLPSHSEIASMQAVETHREELAEELEEVRQPFWITGATLLSDGRKSRDGRTIVNFLVAGSRGVVVYTTINREGEPDDAVHVLRRWRTIFHEFSFGGPQWVNAICTDSASAYMGAARALASPGMPPAIRRITWLPCSIRWEPWWHTMATIVHIMQPVMELLRRMDRGGQYMSLMIKWTQDLVRRVTDACAPLRRVFADRIIRRVQARTQHMLEPAHCAGFLLNPRRRHVEYFSGEVRDYPRWLVRQAKRNILTQAGYEEDGVEHIIACRQFEDFHMQQDTFGDWGGGEGRARGRACSANRETIECASCWSQYGSGAPELQRCALRVMHMWSCASPAERNWAVHEGIHTKKRNQLAFEKVVQLVEITANVRLSEYRRAGCGYVLPWQWHEGMLDCQAGLELEPVRTGTRRGMTPEEIARQVVLITWDPIGVSAPPAAEAVFGRCASIFRPYPREDDSDEEPVPEAADHPALRIPREIDAPGLEEDTRAHTARWAADREEREMMGGEEELWGPFREVASTGGTGARATSPAPTRQESSMPPPFAPSPAPPSPVAPYESTTAAEDTEELASSLPQHGLLHRGGAEEGGPSAAAVEGEMAVEGGLADTAIAGVVDQIAVAAATLLLEEMTASILAEEAPAPGGADAVEGQAGAAGGAAGGAAALDGLVAAAAGAARRGSDAVGGGMPGAVEEEIGAQAEVSRGGGDERLMQQFLTEQYDPVMSGGVVETAPRTRDMPPPPHRPPVGDPSSSPTGRGSRSPHTPGRSRIRDNTAVVGNVSDTALFGRADIDFDSTRHVTEHTARLQSGLGPRDGKMTAAREVAAPGCEPQRGRDRGVSADSLEYALMAATRAVHEQTPRKRGVPPRPRPVPAEGGDALGETSGAKGLGMPRGSLREQTVTEASARDVVLRKAGSPVTIEEDDPETDVAVREEDEDYEGEEEGEEESERGFDGDYDHDEHEPPPPPRKRAARRRAAQTSSSSRGRRSSTSGTRGGTRRQSGKGKKRR